MDREVKQKLQQWMLLKICKDLGHEDIKKEEMSLDSDGKSETKCIKVDR